MKNLILFLILTPFLLEAFDLSSRIYSHHWQGSLPHYSNDSSRSFKILIHHSFTVRLNLKTHLADWVAYELNPHRVWGSLKEKREWESDPLLKKKEGLDKKDYDQASRYGYERGHLAPLGSFKGSVFSYQHQYLTNIAPQKRNLNRGAWKQVEEYTRQFVRKGKEVKVLTGPLYGHSEEMLKNYKTPPASWNQKKLKQIPSGFWKIIYTKEKGLAKVCSVVMPQNIPSMKSSFKKYIVKMQNIKNHTGLILFKNNTQKIKETCAFLTQK